MRLFFLALIIPVILSACSVQVASNHGKEEVTKPISHETQKNIETYVRNRIPTDEKLLAVRYRGPVDGKRRSMGLQTAAPFFVSKIHRGRSSCAEVAIERADNSHYRHHYRFFFDTEGLVTKHKRLTAEDYTSVACGQRRLTQLKTEVSKAAPLGSVEKETLEP
ncbi:hypothetical protein N9K16_01310 [Alphaproteobacteria bacterium]|nr:hypothetical protein [Alphaproteobacteria bacterium]